MASDVRSTLDCSVVRITDLRTPCVLVDRPRLERNIDRMQAAVDDGERGLRPHTKTHKSIEIGRKQLSRGARGICCAKLGEAEVFADAGFEDIRIAYPLNPVNLTRVLALAERVRLSFIVDHPAVAREWSEGLRAAQRTVDVLVKVDVGLHRCGIDPHAPGAAEFVAAVAGMPGLNLRGLLSHAGHAYGATSAEEAEAIARREAQDLNALAARAAALGVVAEEVSVGATPTARFSARIDGVTELRPGNYVYYDRMQVALGSATWDDCALTVLARVVTTHAPDRIVLDCGSKTLSNDIVRSTGNPGYGVVLQGLHDFRPDAALLIERLSEEHAVVKADGASSLQPGHLVRVVPNHSCVVSNLVDQVWLVEEDRVLEQLDVSARGRIT
jgi:D-serine deaminase-like pyridoxal phosphate-dependent protein